MARRKANQRASVKKPKLNSLVGLTVEKMINIQQQAEKYYEFLLSNPEALGILNGLLTEIPKATDFESAVDLFKEAVG
jgi:hypothetical protein